MVRHDVHVALKAKGLLLTDKAEKEDGVPVHKRGIKLSWLRQCVQACPANTAWTSQELVSRLLGGTNNWLWDLIPSQFRAVPACAVIVAPCMPVTAAVDALLYALDPPPPSVAGHTSQAQAPATDADNALWIDWVALGRPAHAADTTLDRQEEEWAEAAPIYMRDLATTCEAGAVMVIDPSAAVLDNARCMFSAWAMMTYSGNDPMRLSVALPPDPHPSLISRLLGSTSTTSPSPAPAAAARLVLDVARVAATGHAASRLMAEVKRVAGAQRASSQLSAVLARGTRLALRAAAGHSLHAAALRVGVLLGEGALRLGLGAAQEVVAAHDEGAEVAELRELFEVYDKDGSGALDVDELGEVMEAAGWGREEGARVYEAMKASRPTPPPASAKPAGDAPLAGAELQGDHQDGGADEKEEEEEGDGDEEEEGVTREEFEAWLLSSVAVKEGRPATGGWGYTRMHPSPTVAILAGAVRSLISLLESRGAGRDLVAHVRNSLAAGCPAAASILDDHDVQVPTQDGVAGPGPAGRIQLGRSPPAAPATTTAASARGRGAGRATAGATAATTVAATAAATAGELPPVRVAGAWREAGDGALWAARGGVDAQAAAARGLFEVLITNPELLPCPPAALPRPPPPPSLPAFAHAGPAPATASSSTQYSGSQCSSTQCGSLCSGSTVQGSAGEGVRWEMAVHEALAGLMVAFADGVVAAAAGRTSGDVAVFHAAAAELRATAAAGPTSPGTPQRGQGDDPSMRGALASREGQALVRGLVTLKYGDRAPSPAMRAEAGVALSQIIAGARAGGVRRRRAGARVSAAATLEGYLGSIGSSGAAHGSSGGSSGAAGSSRGGAAGGGGAAGDAAPCAAAVFAAIAGPARRAPTPHASPSSPSAAASTPEGCCEVEEGEEEGGEGGPTPSHGGHPASRRCASREGGLAAGLGRLRRLQQELSQRHLTSPAGAAGGTLITSQLAVASDLEDNGNARVCGSPSPVAAFRYEIGDAPGTAVRHLRKLPSRSVTIGSATEFASRAAGYGGTTSPPPYASARLASPTPRSPTPSLSCDGPSVYPLSPSPTLYSSGQRPGSSGLSLPALGPCTNAWAGSSTCRSAPQSPIPPSPGPLLPSPPSGRQTPGSAASRFGRGSLSQRTSSSLASVVPTAPACDRNSSSCGSQGLPPTLLPSRLRPHRPVKRVMSFGSLLPAGSQISSGSSSDEADAAPPGCTGPHPLLNSRPLLTAATDPETRFDLGTACGAAGAGDGDGSQGLWVQGAGQLHRPGSRNLPCSGITSPPPKLLSGSSRVASPVCSVRSLTPATGAGAGAGSLAEQLRRKSRGNLIVAAWRECPGLGAGCISAGYGDGGTVRLLPVPPVMSGAGRGAAQGAAAAAVLAGCGSKGSLQRQAPGSL